MPSEGSDGIFSVCFSYPKQVADTVARGKAGRGVDEQGADCLLVVTVAGRTDAVEQDRELVPRQHRLVSRHNARMAGFADVVADEQLFVEFFAGTQSGNEDFDVAVGLFGCFGFEAA